MAGEHDQVPAWAIDISRFEAGANAFRISSKRYVAIRSHHKIVAFERHLTEVHFLWHGSITSITRQDEEWTWVFVIKVSVEGNFDEEPRYLDDYAYSLLKVYRYEEPWRHFNRSYVRLDPFDFETIVRGWIFWARTAFGTFANALPNVKLFEYLQLAVEQQPTRVIKGGSMTSAWQLLKDFIDDEYVVPAELFLESASAIRELSQELQSGVLVEFFGVSDNDEQADPIVEQAERFDALVTSLYERSEGPVMQQFDGAIDRDRRIDDRFEKRFEEVRWPLHVIASF